MVNKPEAEALIEIFGTPHPSETAVLRWKRSWRDTRGRIEVKSYKAALDILIEAGVDPLFYQFAADVGAVAVGGAERYFIVFYKDEHEVFFKLHAGLA